MTTENQSRRVTRRNFIKSTAALGTAAMLTDLGSQRAHAGNSGTLKVGLVGCGGRGVGAAINAVESQNGQGVQIVALGDLFMGRVKGEDLTQFGGKRYPGAMTTIPNALQAKKFNLAACYKVTADTCFDGFDCYKKVIDSGIDIVILATPPGFRPMMLEYAVEKGVHVFMEKPVCTDFPGGVRVIAAGEKAKQKGLAIVAGTQRRHEEAYLQILDRVQNGEIGEIVGGQCYWNGGTLWHRGENPDWTPMEHQCRNWIYYTWLSGDHIAEQHVHNIDILNWALGGPPEKCMSTGGRLVRTDPKFGNVYDHFACEFEYANGARVASYCRQMAGATNRVSEVILGTKGKASASGVGRILGHGLDADGKPRELFRYKVQPGQRKPNPYVQEHADLIASIRSGKPLNEAKDVADSCLTALMGAISAYTGRQVKYEALIQKAKRSIFPEKLEFGPAPQIPVALPGQNDQGNLRWYLG